MKYNGIIFDFNGVILLDSEWQEQAWKQASAEIRGYPLTTEEMQTYVHGRRNKDTFEYLLGKEVDAEETLQLIQIKENIYRDICLSKKEEFKLSPGTEQLLDWIVSENISHTIATASEITNVNFFIKHLKLDKWFDKNLIVYDDGMLPGKPEPDIYLLAAKKINSSPKSCIVLEDSKSGIESARRAGIGKIIAFGPVRKFDELRALPGVNKVISRLDEISPIDFE